MERNLVSYFDGLIDERRRRYLADRTSANTPAGVHVIPYLVEDTFWLTAEENKVFHEQKLAWPEEFGVRKQRLEAFTKRLQSLPPRRDPAGT